MKAIVQKNANSQVELKIEVPKEELQGFIDKALLSLGKEVKIEGFRKGHAPKEMVEKHIGQEKILKEATEDCARESYLKAVLEERIEPIGQPAVEILKIAPGNPFEFKVTVSVMPEIKLPDYKKIAAGVKRKVVTVAEKEVEDSLLWLQKSRAKLSLKNEAARKGDFVEIEYSSPRLESGKIFKDAFFLGEGRFVNGFEQNLEGAKAAEEKEFSVKFPGDYAQKDLAGKEIFFNVKIKSVKIAELPELSDEFAKGLGKFENFEALKQNIKQGITTEKESKETGRLYAEILDKISEASVCQIPEVLVESEKKRAPDLPQEQVKKRAMNGLVLREISRTENIEASDEEIKEEVDRFLKQYPDAKTAEKQFDAERLKEYIKDAIINEKILKLLESFAK